MIAPLRKYCWPFDLFQYKDVRISSTVTAQTHNMMLANYILHWHLIPELLCNVFNIIGGVVYDSACMLGWVNKTYSPLHLVKGFKYNFQVLGLVSRFVILLRSTLTPARFSPLVFMHHFIIILSKGGDPTHTS